MPSDNYIQDGQGRGMTQSQVNNRRNGHESPRGKRNRNRYGNQRPPRQPQPARLQVHVHLAPTTERVERHSSHETEVFFVPVEREPSFWHGFGNAIIALAGVVAVGLVAIGVILAVASLVDDEPSVEGFTALTAQNAALQQQLADYVGDCADGTPAGVDYLRVINTRNPQGSDEPSLIYAGCIPAEEVMGGNLTSP